VLIGVLQDVHMWEIIKDLMLRRANITSGGSYDIEWWWTLTMKHWRWWLVTRLRLWSCRSISNDEHSSVANQTKPWRRSLSTPRVTATVTVMTYTTTCQRECVHSLWHVVVYVMTPMITRQPSHVMIPDVFNLHILKWKSVGIVNELSPRDSRC